MIYAADCETSGLLDMLYEQECPKLHNFCAIPIDGDEILLFHKGCGKSLQAFFDTGPTLVVHNGKTFDCEALRFFNYDLSKCKIIDSLALSWYLEPARMRHGLAEYGEEFGVPKPVIEDWENQTQEDYNHRVVEDCKIQKLLWLSQVKRLEELYGKKPGSYDVVLNFFNWKMQQQVIQQRYRWKLDVPEAEVLQQKLEVEIEKKTLALGKVMPNIAVWKVCNPPSKPFKKSGELSATGEKWKELTESQNLPFHHKLSIKIISGWKEPNPASHAQIKDWLYKLGWEPMTFKFTKDADGNPKNIPQVNLQGGEVCQSVIELIPKCKGIENIAGLGILNHRNSVVKGFLRDHVNGELIAGCQGFTNTLRLQHREIVNLPSLRVKYGEDLRGLLVAREGKILLGSDLSSLEDSVKHHFQIPIDPEYVKSQMTDGFDPHNAIAIAAGLMTQEQADFYRWYKKEHK